MDKVYKIEMEARSKKILKVKASDAETAVSMLLNMYFNSNAICLNNRDVHKLDINAEAVEFETPEDYCAANCERHGNTFNVFIDGEDRDFVTDMADEV